MTKEELGRTVPAESARSLLIILYLCFKEMLSQRKRGKCIYLFTSLVWKSSLEWSRLGRWGWKEGCVKVELNPAEKAETSWKVVPSGSTHSASRKILQHTLKNHTSITKRREAEPHQGFHHNFLFSLSFSWGTSFDSFKNAFILFFTSVNQLNNTIGWGEDCEIHEVTNFIRVQLLFFY